MPPFFDANILRHAALRRHTLTLRALLLLLRRQLRHYY